MKATHLKELDALNLPRSLHIIVQHHSNKCEAPSTITTTAINGCLATTMRDIEVYYASEEEPTDPYDIDGMELLAQCGAAKNLCQSITIDALLALVSTLNEAPSKPAKLKISDLLAAGRLDEVNQHFDFEGRSALILIHGDDDGVTTQAMGDVKAIADDYPEAAAHVQLYSSIVHKLFSIFKSVELDELQNFATNLTAHLQEIQDHG